MKKILFLLFAAIMANVSGVGAQEENYNMIIKMADGTTVFVNPHDVDSISFNNGEVSVSGSNIDQLVQTIKEYQERFITLENNMKTVLDLTATKTEVLENSYRIKGDAQIIDPETGEPYTVVVESAWWEYDEETDEEIYHEAITGPLTMERLLANLSEQEENLSWMEHRVNEFKEIIVGLYDPLQEFLGCDYWDTWYTGQKLVEFLDDLKSRLDALDGGGGDH